MGNSTGWLYLHTNFGDNLGHTSCYLHDTVKKGICIEIVNQMCIYQPGGQYRFEFIVKDELSGAIGKGSATFTLK